MADNNFKCERCRRRSPRLSQSYEDGRWDCDPCAVKDKGMPDEMRARYSAGERGKGGA